MAGLNGEGLRNSALVRAALSAVCWLVISLAILSSMSANLSKINLSDALCIGLGLMFTDAASSGAIAKRTDFFGLASVAAAKRRAFSTVVLKLSSRECKRKYCDISAEFTPSSKRLFSAESRCSAGADGQASRYNVRKPCSNSAMVSESDCFRKSKRLIASRVSSMWPKRRASMRQISS